MSESAIEWREPPPPHKGRAQLWTPLLEPLMAKPGMWAMVRKFPASKQARAAASNLKAGTARHPDGEWEFTCRGTELFARYLGPNGEAKR